ncbi:sensor histidine kinase [Pseudoduganella violaceinigra]|uniref:sensor histidine kinase n=1 Tax=Pseudoduganella violaceinigra TaxID=246602 RepID=UPI0013785A9A|nr:histidine kinase [Pseudoduganella violaceinigra]
MNRLHSLPAWLRALLANFTLWTLVCAMAGLTTYADRFGSGDTRSYWEMTAGWWFGYAVMMIQSYALYMAYRRRPAWLASLGRIALGYLAYLALCWPSAMLGLAFRRCIKFDIAPTLANAWNYVVTMDKLEWFVEFSLLTMAYGAVVAFLLGRQRQQQDRQLAQAMLSLERQRLAALRGQLEPHFIFNTLSAIGALVRLDDKALALDGLSRLGDLLEYALASSENDWVEATAELRFVRNYLDLQRLRFGERLHVRIEGAHLLDDDIECPPMLLQPLVENALRHDIECHDAASDIAVAFGRDGERLNIRVSNPIRPHAAPEAGLGIGLRGISARLRLAYGEAASLTTRRMGDRFVAELSIPWAVRQ